MCVPPAVKANLCPQPLQPFRKVLFHKRLAVVNVGGCIKAGAACSITPAFELTIVHDNSLRIPCHATAKLVPDAILVLRMQGSTSNEPVCVDEFGPAMSGQWSALKCDLRSYIMASRKLLRQSVRQQNEICINCNLASRGGVWWATGLPELEHNGD